MKSLAERFKGVSLRAVELKLQVLGVELTVSRVPQEAVNNILRQASLKSLQVESEADRTSVFFTHYKAALLEEIFKHIKAWDLPEHCDAENIAKLRGVLKLSDEYAICDAYEAVIEQEEAAAAGNGSTSGGELSTP